MHEVWQLHVCGCWLSETPVAPLRSSPCPRHDDQAAFLTEAYSGAERMTAIANAPSVHVLSLWARNSVFSLARRAGTRQCPRPVTGFLMADTRRSIPGDRGISVRKDCAVNAPSRKPGTHAMAMFGLSSQSGATRPAGQNCALQLHTSRRFRGELSPIGRAPREGSARGRTGLGHGSANRNTDRPTAPGCC